MDVTQNYIQFEKSQNLEKVHTLHIIFFLISTHWPSVKDLFLGIPLRKFKQYYLNFLIYHSTFVFTMEIQLILREYCKYCPKNLLNIVRQFVKQYFVWTNGNTI